MTFFYVPSLNFEPSQPKRCIRVRKGEGVELQINEIMVTLWKCGDWGYLFSPGVFSSGGPPGPAGPVNLSVAQWLELRAEAQRDRQ